MRGYIRSALTSEREPGLPNAAETREVGWTAVTGAVLLIVAALTALVVRGAASSVIMSFGVLVACVIFYHGLIHWNRTGSLLSDPGDRLNGAGGLLVMAGMFNLVLEGAGRTDQALISAQPSFLSLSAVLITFVTVLTIGALNNLRDDRRLRLWTGCAALGLGTELAATVGGVGTTVGRPVVWLLLGVLILGIAGIPRTTPYQPVVITTQPTTLGALAVLVTAVVLLAISDRSLWSTVYGVLTTASVSIRLFTVVKDLENLARARNEARTDDLTGLPNRRGLRRALSEALATGETVSLVMLDLNRFKAINDRYGHTVGDRLLQELTLLFAGSTPPGSMLARLGGDEFALLLPGASRPQAVEQATRLQEAVASVTEVAGLKIRIGASTGIAEGRWPVHTSEELMRRADVAMYLAKSNRQGVRIYDADLDTQAQAELQLVEDLHRALGDGPDRRQIAVFFQPQVDTVSGAVTGAEALVRWHHPRLGLLAPVRFIDLAESSGLMGRLTERVLDCTTEETARWRALGRSLRVSVNISASSLRHSDLLTVLDGLLAAGQPPGELMLELTESTLMDDPDEALRMMHAIAARGIGLSIDDYGTGYSSLAYLTDLPATELKIDRSFTVRIPTDARIRAVVAGTVELAHQLGMRLVAEGVEDEVTLAAVRQLRCDVTQGYLISRPLPADAFLDWLQAREPVPAPRAPEALEQDNEKVERFRGR